jgi:hypothetical protein
MNTEWVGGEGWHGPGRANAAALWSECTIKQSCLLMALFLLMLPIFHVTTRHRWVMIFFSWSFRVMGPIGVIIKCVSLNELFLTGRTRFKFRQNLTENTKDRGFAKCSSMTEHGMNNRTFPYTSNMHFSINYTSSCCKNMRVCSICKLPVFCDRIEQQPTVDRYICINLSHHSEQHQLQPYVICAQKMTSSIKPTGYRM